MYNTSFILFLKNINHWIHQNKGGIGVLFIISILFWSLCHFTPLAFDDYAYSFSLYNNQRISSLNDILKSLQVHYNEANGRIVSHFFAYLFLWIDKNIFDLFTTLIFILFGLLLYYNGTGSIKRIDTPILTAVYIMIFVLTPKFGENYLWITGACNYLFMSVIFLLYWSFYVNRMQSCKNNIIFLIISLVGGIIVGNAHECVAAITLCLLPLLFFVYRRRNLLLFLCSFSGTLIGACLLLFAPGQSARVEKSGTINLISILENFIRITFSIIENFTPIFILILILLMINTRHHNIACKDKYIEYFKHYFLNHPLIIMYGIVFVITIYALTIMPYVPDGRVWIFYLQLLIIITCILLKRVNKAHRKPINYVIAFSSILTAIVVSKYIFKSESIYLSWENRNKEILEMKQSGISDVIITPLGKSHKYHVFSHRGEEISTDPNYWVNLTMARYHGVDSIKMAPLNNYK